MAKNILIVDDSATMRQQLRTLLSTNGFGVVEGVDGSDGLCKAKATSADLLIVDVNMPLMNGIEMIIQVRQLPGYAKTPIFVLTTESSRAMVQKGKAAGATAWIVKPFKPDVLLKGIKKLLRL